MLFYRTAHPYSSGFTLLELLIALIMLGILAAISLPSYQDSITSARRSAAKSELLRLAQAEARWRANHTEYADLNNVGGAQPNEDYTFSGTHSATEFTLTATPTNNHQQDRDVCGSISINQLGVITSNNREHCPNP